MADFVATVTLIDSLSTQVTKRYETETDVLATAQAAVALLITDLEAITDLGVVSVTYSLKDVTEASAAAEGSSVDAGATFRCRLADGSIASHKVPGFPIAKVGGNRAIDPTDVDVAAYFANFEAGGDFTLSDGEVITAVLSGTFDV
jgi:hypothetical protein